MHSSDILYQQYMTTRCMVSMAGASGMLTPVRRSPPPGALGTGSLGGA